ncbi:hypothetical protein KOW79_008781 [Hemibagrus wyckioides]|uniref:Uncharacterized protein n=1 Tax=Hemibagrus wyckioides TaxID=337641 RepID=A0A9D3NRH2_9TELE|nr:hypothetical protein KOW79_008781 [Hemibagrus wyckioides]
MRMRSGVLPVLAHQKWALYSGLSKREGPNPEVLRVEKKDEDEKERVEGDSHDGPDDTGIYTDLKVPFVEVWPLSSFFIHPSFSVRASLYPGGILNTPPPPPHPNPNHLHNFLPPDSHLPQRQVLSDCQRRVKR